MRLDVASLLGGALLRPALSWLGRCRLPRLSGCQALPGLLGRVEVLRDRWGVAHLYASNDHDLFFAQGLVHAQDRLWQMELSRRLATGRLSELFGELTLHTDRTIRTLGLPQLAAADWQGLDEALRAALLAYAAGVNAFLQQGPLPLECWLLGHRPEPWQATDSLAIVRLLAWQLSPGWYGKLVAARLAGTVGEARARDLLPQYPPTHPLTVPPGVPLPPGTPHHPAPWPLAAGGSNAWAVAGHRTTSGAPLLCSDPHLPLTLPAVWYANHLHAGAWHVSGVSIPGVPLVTIGHNQYLAWGMTVAFTDTADLVVEHFDGMPWRRYRHGDTWCQATVRTETIGVRGRLRPHVEEVVSTHHGPIVSALFEAAQPLALQAMALRVPSPLTGWWRLNRADSWEAFVEAVRGIAAPGLNVVYADVEGNIGYWLAGKVPLRSGGPAWLPRPGWTAEGEWRGEVPFAAMPHAYNPPQGFLVSCNHRIVGDDYPYPLGYAWMNGYRARRLTEVLAATPRVSPEDCRAWQGDVRCLPALELARHLAGLAPADPAAQAALAQVQAWDGRLTPDSVAGALYEVLREELARQLLEPVLGKALAAAARGQGPSPLLPAHEFYGHDTLFVLRQLADPASWWVAQAGGRDAVLARSVQQSVAWLRQHLGADWRRWQWGRLHQATFLHALGLKPLLAAVFNRGPYPLGGDTDTLCQTASLPGTFACNFSAPGYRQVIDLGDFSRSQAILAPGQSGWLGSRHYDDLIPLWRRGDYYPMLWRRREIEAAAVAWLRLEPA
ncbi:MAG: peptidase S45 [Candidatus Tectimicrobiota bacterium]|nr:MAG: peptidase S45 [Candidatus Tectomicrobia bacterium]